MCFTVAITLIFPQVVGAQYFTAGKGDLLAGFRKTGSYQGSYELLVNLGNVTNFLALPAGSSITMSNYTASQLSAAFSDYNHLQWSVFSAVDGAPFSSWPNSSGFYLDTIWFTLPRTTVNTQTTPPTRGSESAQGNVVTQIASIRNGGNTLSSYGSPATNANNNPLVIREPAGDASSYSKFAADPLYPALGDFGGNLAAGNAENITPASFSSAVVSDFYQSVTDGHVDPSTGNTTGAAYFMGYFTLNTDGTLTFTRASIATAQPPVPLITSITRTNTTAYVSFTTTNGGFTYSLYFTNATGLAAPIANWPVSPITITGNGLTNTLQDTTTDPLRFYRVGVH